MWNRPYASTSTGQAMSYSHWSTTPPFYMYENGGKLYIDNPVEFFLEDLEEYDDDE